MTRQDERRRGAFRQLQEAGVLMPAGHYDYGNGYHGRAYLNPHLLFLHPATIWRLAQDLLDLLPGDLLDSTDVVAGPATGGALLAHTMAGLLEGRRSLARAPLSFAPFTREDGTQPFVLRGFYARQIAGKRVLLADDVRNTGATFERCARLVEAAGGTVVGTVEICDRMASLVNLGVPNYALVEYETTENYAAAGCPMCRAGEPVTTF